MTALFQLTAEYRATCDKLADLDLDPQTLADTLEGERWPLEVKAQNVAVVILGLEAQAKAMTDRAKALKEQAESAERRAEHLRDYLSTNLRAAEITKVEGPDVSIAWRKSTAVEIEDEALLPAEFMVTPPAPAAKPNKAAISAALKAGREVAGARLEHRQNLQIR